jgi:hypothetical protein
MSRVKLIADNVYIFYCPGCKEEHTVHVNGKRNGSSATWSFDLNMDRPTFSPSIHLKTGKYADPNWDPPDDQAHWNVICHSFVRGGNIQFLNDCTHDLKGKTVELPNIFS